MAFLNCKCCGGKIKTDEKQPVYICSACGKRYILRKIESKHRNNASDGISYACKNISFVKPDENNRLQTKLRSVTKRVKDSGSKTKKWTVKQSAMMFSIMAAVFILSAVSAVVIKTIIQSNRYRNEVKMLSDVSVGEYIKFGNYKGNNEWKVLEKKDGKILVLSKYAIENIKYHDGHAVVTWETCSLRNWLNEKYIKSSFSTKEQELIIPTQIVNCDNQIYSTDGGNDTTDKLFILSVDEANRYFESDDERQATLSDGTPAWWWLRTPGGYRYYATLVYSDGLVFDFGFFVYEGCAAVRPAMWLDVSNL